MNRVKNTGIEHPTPLFTLAESEKLRAKVNAYLDQKMIEWERTVPYSKHLEDKKINLAYYKRHTIEHVWRIRMSRTGQCRALHAIAKKSPEAAQLYARYQDEEMLHDSLYEQDLISMGITKEEILKTEPFLSTRLLESFFYFIAEHENPIGVICFGYLVEYTTKHTTPKQLSAMKSSLGEEHIQGQIAHLNTDLVEDHSGEMWKIMNNLIFSQEDIDCIFKYFDEHQYLLSLYFKELYEATVVKSNEQVAV